MTKTVKKTSNAPLKKRFVAFEVTQEIRDRFTSDLMTRRKLSKAQAETALMDVGIRKLMATRGHTRRSRAK